MACHWKPLCHLSLKSKSADLSPGLWQKSYFFVLTHTHTHHCSGLMDTWLSQLVNVWCLAVRWTHGCPNRLIVRCLAVRWTHGCPNWWMFTVLLMDTWLSQLVDRWLWLCDDISAKLSSAIGHWRLDKWNFSLTIRWQWGPGSSAFPWGSFISGYEPLHITMLISLPAVWSWRSSVWLQLFPFFYCAVFVWLSARVLSFGLFVMIYRLIMVHALFAWLCFVLCSALYVADWHYLSTAFSFCDCFMWPQSLDVTCYSIVIPYCVVCFTSFLSCWESNNKELMVS